MDIVVLFVLFVSGAAIVTIVFQAMTGKREDGISDPRVGLLWRPPARQEDEYEKWNKL